MKAFERSEKKREVNVGPLGRWLSVIGGSLLAYKGLRRPGKLGKVAMETTGGYLLYRGATGNCPVSKALGISAVSYTGKKGITVENTVFIRRSVEDIYSYWHNFENLPNFMKHVESVKVLDDRRSHWAVITPLGIKMEWTSEMTNDIRNEFIAWRSLTGSDFDNEGSVSFKRDPGGAGTDLTLKMTYYPPAGTSGVASSEMFQNSVLKEIGQDLERFKEIMEKEVYAASA